MSAKLKRKISTKKANIAVVGLGYVGLPLAVNLAKAGFCVHGLDLDADRIEKLRRKKSYISDVSTKDVVSVIKKERFSASMDFKVIAQCDCILICVPTPLKRKYTPDISYILGAVRMVRKHLKKDTLIILESTTYPGTTDELIRPELEKSGLRVGKDIFLAFSPERIDPGNKDFDVTRIPKVVGGVTPVSSELTRLLYGKIIKKVHAVSTARAAEMTKLLENSFRIINIGWINEVAMMCHKLGIDVWEVIEAAKTKPFGFMPFYPGLGVGGHCIPDDPLYLFWKARQYGFSSKYIKLSADTNAAMPAYVVDRLAELLKSQYRKRLARARVLVLGVTYKKNVKDLRKSPALKLIELLEDIGAKVDYHDPFIPYLEIGKIHKLNSVPLNRKMLAGYDCAVIATDHNRVNYDMVLRSSRMVFDTKNVYKNKTHPKLHRI